MNSQKNFKKTYSIEFFPPKTPEGAEKLRYTRNQLAELNPEYISVTFGAGGSTQDGTIDTLLEIQKTGIPAAPHLSCIASTKQELSKILQLYKSKGISHSGVCRRSANSRRTYWWSAPWRLRTGRRSCRTCPPGTGIRRIDSRRTRLSPRCG